MSDDGTDAAFAAVREELARASALFRPFRSGHEAVAIIEEEFLEFRNAVFWRDKVGGETTLEQMARARAEAIQLAAMAVRYLVDIGGMK